MNFDAPASTWMDVFATSTDCCIFIFDLQNLVRSSVGAPSYWLFTASFIEIAQVVHETEISW